MLPFPFFKGGLPKWLSQQYLNNDIQKFVHEVMEQSISTSLNNAKMMGSMYMNSEEERKPEKHEEEPEESKIMEPAKASLQATTFESLDHVYVKILLTDSSRLSHLKVYHNSNQLILEGIPDRDDRHVINLPSTVTMKDTVSEFRDSFLQVKMRKRNDPQFTEIAVPPLE